MIEIYKRRSVREYINKDIDKKIIDKILKAGMNAPSSRNSKPWQFIVVNDKNILLELSKSKQGASFLKDANVCIVICAKSDSDLVEQDIGVCMENMILESTHLGVSSCYIGVYPNIVCMDNIKKATSIPQEYIVYSVLSLGYSDVETLNNDRFEPERIHYNCW